MKFDHSDALESLAARMGRSPLDVLELFLERAAIREYDGGLTRADAERLALEDVTDMLQRAACAADAIGKHRQGVGTSNEVASDEVRHERSQQPPSTVRGAS